MKKPAAKKAPVRRSRKNPPPRARISAAAIERFRKFHDFDPSKVIAFPVPSRRIPKEMVIVGDLEAVAYISDKWEGKKEHYYHEFKKSDRPKLCMSADGKQLFILGGCYHVEPEGIVD